MYSPEIDIKEVNINQMNISLAVSDFNYNFFRELVKNEDSQTNLCSSLTLIYLALASLNIGSFGSTSAQFKEVLGVDYSSILFKQDSQLQITLKQNVEALKQVSKLSYLILHSEKIKEDYENITRDIFEAQFVKIGEDLEATCERANQWVSKNTGGMINNILTCSMFSPNTKLLLLNTIYFQSKWKKSFLKLATSKDEFYVDSSKKVRVWMMHSTENLLYNEEPSHNLQIIAKEFKDEGQLAVFILPPPSTTIQHIIDAINTENVHNWLNSAKEIEVEIHIPRFSIKQKFNAREILKSMNLTDIFDKGCDFRGIVDDSLFVSDVIHFSRVDVDEEGAIAAASTLIPARACYNPFEGKKVFRANRPFIFMIYDKNLNVPIFINAVNNPAK